MQTLSILCLFLLIPFIISCDTSVHRVDPNNVENEVNTRWDTKDMNIFVQEMLASLRSHRLASSNPPVKIRVTKVRNKTGDHQVDTKNVTYKIQENLLEWGCYRIVSDAEDLGDDNEERDYSDTGYGASGSERSKEEMSDYMFRGQITELAKGGGGVTDRTFQISLELVNTKTSEKMWVKTAEVRKQQSQGWFGS
ncbi:MAG: hypothetical protein AABZ60_08950 [Planctomycetota bacterium]